MNLQKIRGYGLRVVETASAFAGLALMGMSNAHAVFTLPTEITDAQANVLIVGGGVFAIAVGVKLYKWFKGAL